MYNYLIMRKITIKEKDQNQRLDKFLTEKLKGESRSQVQKMIKNGEILINGKKVLPHCFLKIGDVITSVKPINDKQASTEMAQKDEANKKNESQIKNYKLRELIQEETPDYLIINKPSGLSVHRGEGTEKDEITLADLILKEYPDLKDVGDLSTPLRARSSTLIGTSDPMRPGIIHRLDKDVSGLLVIAKTQEIFDWLKKNFKSREIKKEYTALVYGTIRQSSGTIDFAIDREKGSNKMLARVKGGEGKEAITKFEVLKQFQRYTLLKVNIKTGRTHQIRVHLKAYNHPIVGDELYGGTFYKPRKDISRIFLHSTTLGFYDINNTWREYHSDLPQELEKFLTTLA